LSRLTTRQLQEQKIAFDYPSDWIISYPEEKGIMLLLKPPSNIDNSEVTRFHIQVDDVSYYYSERLKHSAEGFMEIVSQQTAKSWMKSDPSIRLMESDPVRIDGIEARRLLSTQGENKILDFFVCIENTFYTMRFFASAQSFSSYLPTIQRIIGAIEFVAAKSSLSGQKDLSGSNQTKYVSNPEVKEKYSTALSTLSNAFSIRGKIGTS
jgi:PsbP-like protein